MCASAPPTSAQRSINASFGFSTGSGASSSWLIVRAEVEEASREAFDRWYENEHLPEAHRDFNAVSAFRGWSDVDPGVHLAYYEFPDLVAANAILNSDLIKEFIKEFDRHWEGKVVRSRETFEVKQILK